MFHRFGQAKIANDGLVSGLSRFSILPQLPYKMMLDSKLVKIDSKLIILLCLSKSVTCFVGRETLHRVSPSATKRWNSASVSPVVGHDDDTGLLGPYRRPLRQQLGPLYPSHRNPHLLKQHSTLFADNGKKNVFFC